MEIQGPEVSVKFSGLGNIAIPSDAKDRYSYQKGDIALDEILYIYIVLEDAYTVLKITAVINLLGV